MNTLTDVTVTQVVVLAFIDGEHYKKLTGYKQPAGVPPLRGV